jgi:hypothetical protein
MEITVLGAMVIQSQIQQAGRLSPKPFSREGLLEQVRLCLAESG